MKHRIKVRFLVEAALGHHGEVLRDAYEDEAVVEAEDVVDAWDQVRSCDRNFISAAPLPPETPALQPAG